MLALKDAAEVAQPARDRALSHILNQQAADGSFRDFRLPVGVSDAWTTAFVAAHLADEPDPKAKAAAMAAADWLNTHAAGGAWGYNLSIDPDADSTAWALMLFTRLGLGVSADSIRFIQSLRRAGGGFATFDSGDAWGAPHACVTAVVLHVLASTGRNCAAETARWLRGQRPPGDAWSGYWWGSPFYPTMVCLEALASIGPLSIEERGLLRHAPGLKVARSALDVAAALRIATVSGMGASARLRLGAALLSLQLPDGSLPASGALRVTRHDVLEPRIGATDGALYADTARVFGTTVAWAALRALDDRRNRT